MSFNKHYNSVCSSDCPNRSWDCHAKCEAYLEERAAKEARYRATEMQYMISDYQFGVASKIAKTQERKRRK